MDKVREGKIILADAKIYQVEFKLSLGNQKYRSKDQKNAIYSVEMLCKTKIDIIKFFDDYSSMVSVARHEVTKGEGLKILTSKQMLQRLPIALA